ncbi:methylmalonyl Co-A mutase-associated GTPase MeaB [Zobellia sp. OII3]|uniref:methylmalonyl Co-A mutase-associated GTPase MeaB n=1 Tax=Zobellia sp. OII3 TaxID=2034520 RepID=UPI000B530B0F
MKPIKNTDSTHISDIRKKRKVALDPKTLADALQQGDKTALGRAITLVESNHQKHYGQANAIIKQCLKHKNKSIRIGITGVPGVGKSTFIETLGRSLTSAGHKIAVLTVDPTSTQSRGSILGDKTRMETLAKDSNAFIRPSPSGLSLGGVARKTRESIVLCEAAGYPIILVETVGVGQNETTVHGMVDFFLLLKLAGAGDELQGIKRGIVEMADAIVINKADGDNRQKAEAAKAEFKNALQLYPPKENGWIPKVLSCSALKNEGITEIWTMIEQYVKDTRKSGAYEEKRKQQNEKWLYEAIEERLKSDFFHTGEINKNLKKYTEMVTAKEISPFQAAEELISIFKTSS